MYQCVYICIRACMRVGAGGRMCARVRMHPRARVYIYTCENYNSTIEPAKNIIRLA